MFIYKFAARNFLFYDRFQYYQLCKLGCSDPVKTSTAFYVYIELCEGIAFGFHLVENACKSIDYILQMIFVVKRFWNVKYKYKEELDLFYLEVRKSQHSSLEIYIPWATKYSISLDKIETMQRALQSER